MKLFFRLLFLMFLMHGCASKNGKFTSVSTDNEGEVSDFTIAFGSCNKQNAKNNLWDDILNQNPDLWIWGGDNVYADTDDMKILEADYSKQLNNIGYKMLTKKVKVMGTWDDHDYGLNDGGAEFKMKRESQQQFLNFLGVSTNDNRRKREGVYHAETINTPKGSIKVLVLDTRYFRSPLVKSNDSKKRYQPTSDISSTILGDQQWTWLANELHTSKADFNIIVGSIQFLSMEHGFETWGNFPHEVDRLKHTIVDSKAKGVLLLSGDRHISEFSKVMIQGLDYPLIDFTSSGLTHSYTGFTSEPNKNRVGEVVSQKSFGVLKFDFKNHKISMEMYADGNKKLQELIQLY